MALLKKGVYRGDAEARYYLCRVYLHEFPQTFDNVSQGLGWYRMAASKGHGTIRYELRVMGQKW